VWYLPGFLAANEASVKYLTRTPGFLKGTELVDKGLVFWTVTAWTDEKAMKTFRNSEAHRKAMQMLPRWCSEAAYAHWLQDNDVLPAPAVLHEKIITQGKLTKVRYPSVRQQLMAYPPVRWVKLSRPLVKNSPI
jgi:heme-degrading monooxygenase HmoA